MTFMVSPKSRIMDMQALHGAPLLTSKEWTPNGPNVSVIKSIAFVLRMVHSCTHDAWAISFIGVFCIRGSAVWV